MMPRVRVLGTLVVVTQCMGVPGLADTPSPVFWTWSAPQGRAATDPRIIQAVIEIARAEYKGQYGPRWCAEQIKNLILDRHLQAGEIAIILQLFGMGDGSPLSREVEGPLPALIQHDADALCPGTGLRYLWKTPWMTHGLVESSAWMQQFIERYQELQLGEPAIPPPTRFHFDVESPLSPWGDYPPASETLEQYPRPWGRAKEHLETLAACLDDTRKDTEPIPGWGGNTLAYLYEEAGAPPKYFNLGDDEDPPGWYFHPNNLDCSHWYFKLTEQAIDAALNQVAYQPIRAAWPGCKSSNYWTSSPMDGLGAPGSERKRKICVDNRGDPNISKVFEYHWKGSADLQAPELYPAPCWKEPNEPLQWDGSIRETRRHVEACRDSFPDDPNQPPITPWLLLVGCRTCAPDCDFAPADFIRRQLTFLRGMQVNEFCIWNDANTGMCQAPYEENWNKLVDLIDQVWGADVSDAQVLLGTKDPASEVNDLRWNERDTPSTKKYFRVQSESGATLHYTETEVTFATLIAWGAEVTRLRVVVEAEVENNQNPVTVSVAILNQQTSQYETLGTFQLGGRQNKHFDTASVPATYQDLWGRVRVRINYTGPDDFVSKIDIVQLVGTTYPP